MTARSAPQGPAPERQRLDKWLWFARIVRRRREAVNLIEAGHVRVDSCRVTVAARRVGLGNVLTLALPTRIRVLRITGLAARRGGAGQCKGLFVELALQSAATPAAI